MTRRRPALRGVTLIEVTVAAALLGVGVAGIISGWSSTTGIIEHQRRFTDATNLTRTALEHLLLLPPNTPDLSDGDHALPSCDSFGRPASGPSSYTTTYHVEPDTPAPGFIELTVTTTWTERAGVRTTSFNTFRER